MRAQPRSPRPASGPGARGSALSLRMLGCVRLETAAHSREAAPLWRRLASPSLIRIPHPDPSCCPSSEPGRVTRHPQASLAPLLLRGGFTFSFPMQPLDHSAAGPEAVSQVFLEKAEPVWGLLEGARSREEGVSSATSGDRGYCRGLGSCLQRMIRIHDPHQLEEPSSVDRALGGSHRDWRASLGAWSHRSPPPPANSG